MSTEVKLYTYDTSTIGSASDLVQPNKYNGDFKIKYWSAGYVSMSVGLASLFNSLNGGALTLATESEVATLKDKVKSTYDTLCAQKIAESYSVSEELRANRLNDTTVLNDISAIVAAVKADRDAWLDIT